MRQDDANPSSLVLTSPWESQFIRQSSRSLKSCHLNCENLLNQHVDQLSSNPKPLQYQTHRILLHQLFSFYQDKISELGNSAHASVTPITIYPIVGVMPQPGQPGLLSFDGTNISNFLKDWELECEE